MADYTTLVRTICETKKHTDSSKIVDIINSMSGEIFEKYPLYDETHRQDLNLKILRHYYFCEIGFETVGLWIEKLNCKMLEIMPTMNELYKTVAIKYDIFNNVDYMENTQGTTSENAQNATMRDTKTSVENSQTVKADSKSTSSENIKYAGGEKSSRSDSGENNGSSTVSGNTSQQTSGSNSKTDKFSDTPQGNLSGVDSNSYLTDYRKVDDSNTATVKETENSTTTNKNTSKQTASETTEFQNRQDTKSGNVSTTQSIHLNSSSTTTDNMQSSDSVLKTGENAVAKTVKGKNTNASYTSLIEEYRNAIINVDNMVIDKLQDLFMMIY